MGFLVYTVVNLDAFSNFSVIYGKFRIISDFVLRVGNLVKKEVK